jgi:TP901 family phage tail tape measure protein
MADDQVVTNIVARADFSDLIANVRKVTTSLAAMQQQIGSSNKVLSAQINAVNRSFGETLRSTGQFSSHFVSLANDVDVFGKRLDGGKLKLRDYFSTLQTHTRTSGGLIRDLARQQVQLQNAILQPLGKNAEGLMQFNVHVPQGLDQIKNKGAIARQEMQILNRVMQEGAGQLINWGKNTQWAGRQLTVGLTVPIAAFGAAAAKAFREADQELTRLTKVYGGLGATSSAELQKVRRDVTAVANELARGYGASFKETLALSADIAATGKQGAELLGSIRETTRLAVLGEVDRQDAMKATLAIQSAFKQDTDELAESINFLNAVENQTSTTLNDLVEAIPKAGPVIKGLGGDVQDLALYLTAMREGGINASEGANALKSALASLINPTDVAVKKFESFGIDLMGIVNNNAGDVTKTLFALQGALDNLSPLQKSQAIEQLFGKFQFARLSALFENLGKQGSQTLQVMDLMKASSKELATIASRELSMVTESASGKYKRAVEGLKADLAGIGEEFLKVSTFFINVVDGIVKFVNNLPGPIKTILTFLAGLTAVTGPLIMLTGVLANFLGYVIKGAFHLKALFKGGEGWRMLTPEILAANQAGSLIEKTFYSDAKAALALAEALQVLSAGMTSIQSKMTQGVVSVQPMLSTVAGSIIKPPGDDGGGGGGIARIVDPKNPLVGPAGTRASAHMVPRSGMSQQERAAQTIHSFLPAPIPVNQAIGANPQIFASGDLPSVPGLTTISGKSGAVSTGVVSSEAAKWHTMVGTLSMMTKTEVAQMRTQLRTTGTVSSEFTQAFGSLLPQMTSIAENAAQQSAVIVAEAKAGTISVQTARQRIIALNIQVEQLMAQATMGTATSLGRTAVLTGVPTLDQPVVDPKTGKSNMRELFKKGKTRSFVDDLARLMGVRTWGAGYSTHTTIPIRRNMGGKVYNPDVHGNVVPGDTSINYDNTPAVLREGGFILNQSSSRINPDLVSLAKNSKNAGGKIVPAILTPGETYFPPEIAQEIMPTLEKANSGSVVKLLNSGGILGGRVSNKKLNYGIRISPIDILSKLGKWDPNMVGGARRVYDTRSSGSRASNSPRTFGQRSEFGPETYHSLFRRSSGTWGVHGGALRHGERTSDEVLGHVITSKFLKQFKGLPEQGSSRVLTGSQFESRFGLMPGGATPSKVYQVLPDNLITITKDFNAALLNGNATGAMWLASSRQPQHFVSLLSHLLNSGVPYKVAYRTAGKTLDRINKAMLRLKDTNLTETKWGNIVDSSMQAEISALSRSYTKGSMHSFNAGGMVPGGMVSRNRFGYGIPALAASAISRLTARWKPVNPYSPLTQKHDWTNTDPLHGPLFIGRADIGSEGVRRSLSYNLALPDGRRQLVGISPMMSNDPRYLIERYMSGDKAVLARMQDEGRKGLNTHPLSIQSLFRSVARPFRGNLYRGMTSQSVADTLPRHIVEAIERAKATGDFSALIGRAFIMRRASFTADPKIADFFSPGSGGLLLQASLSGRKVTPTSEMFPDKKFQAPYSQDWSGGHSGRRYRSEQESLVGGRFIITGFDGKKLIVEGRAMGGPVSGATPYVVGERGPELFVPKNSGGIIPNYALGGIVKGGKINYGELPPGWSQSLAQPTLAAQMRASGELPPLQTPQPLESSKGAKFGLGAANIGGNILGFMGGSALGSKLSDGNMLVSTIAGVVGSSAVSSGLTKLITSMTSLGTATGAAAGKTSLLTKAFQFFIKLPGPLKLLAAVVGVGLAIETMNNKISEHRRIVSSGFGISEESAKKLGLQYKKLGSEIDAYQQKYDLMLAKAAANRYNQTKAEGKGINITVPELEKLKKQVAKDFPDEIKMFDKATNEEAKERATNLKAGMVAAGKSVEEANEVILAMIMNSNKASIALDILGDRGFGKIQGKISATNSTVKTFSNIIKEGNFDQLPIALQTSVNALDNLQKSFVKIDTNTKKAVTSSQAYERVLNQISTTANQQIGDKGLEEILAQNEGLRDVIDSTDTLAGIWAKIKLSTSGITFNLKDMSSETATAISLLLEQQKDYLRSNDSLISSAADLIAKTGNVTANQLIKNANRTKESIEKEIELRQKNIKRIKDEADAKKKALDEETEAEDFLLQIQKKQIEYSEALSSGDMARAAQAQLDIQSMTGARQLDLAKTAIDDKADKDIQKQQDLIDNLTKALDGLSKTLEKQISAAGNEQAKKSDMQGLYDLFMQAVTLGMGGVTDSEKLIIGDIAKQLRDSGIKEFVDLADKYLKMSPTGNYVGSMQPMGFGALESLGAASFSVIAGKLQVEDTELSKYIKALATGKTGDSTTSFTPKTTTETSAAGGKKTVYTITPDQYVNSGMYKEGEDPVAKKKTFIDYLGRRFQIVGRQEDGDFIVERKFAMGGIIKNFMPGGNVKGPGTGTSDSIPAMLSNGEYVIKAKSVQKYGTQTFDALNAGRFANGGPVNASSLITPSVPYYMADGGSVFSKIMKSAVMSPLTMVGTGIGFGLNLLSKIDSYRKNKDMNKWNLVQGEWEGLEKKTLNPERQSIYVYDMANRYDSKDRRPIVDQALKYLTGQTGVEFKRATFGMRNDPDVVKIDWSDPYSLIKMNASGSSVAGSRKVDLVSPMGLNAFTFNRLGGQNTLAHEILHSLNIGDYYVPWGEEYSHSRFDGHAKNPFNVMFPFVGGVLPQFISKNDTEQLRQITDFYKFDYKDMPVSKAMGGLIGYHKGGPVGHRHGRNATGSGGKLDLSGVMPLLSMPAGSTATVDLNAKPTNASKVADFIFGDLTGINSFNRIITGQAHPLDYAAVVPFLGVGARGVNAVGRSAVEMMGIKAGIPGLGSLLPQGSIPYAASMTSTAIKNSALATSLAGSRIGSAFTQKSKSVTDSGAPAPGETAPFPRTKEVQDAIDHSKKWNTFRENELKVIEEANPDYLKLHLLLKAVDDETHALKMSGGKWWNEIRGPLYNDIYNTPDSAAAQLFNRHSKDDLFWKYHQRKYSNTLELDEIAKAEQYNISPREVQALRDFLEKPLTGHLTSLKDPIEKLVSKFTIPEGTVSYRGLSDIDMQALSKISIGESFVAPTVRSITDNKIAAAAIGAFGGTGGGRTNAIARIIFGPDVKGIADVGILGEAQGLSHEGLIGPNTRFILEQIIKGGAQSSRYENQAGVHMMNIVPGKGNIITETLDEYVLRAVKMKLGGMVSNLNNGGMPEIPKFEKGINMVPANMLAMLHKNEAVVPANMNPFNPNAQSYSQPSISYNIAPVINAAPGMDEQAIANMATRQVLAEIKVMDSRNTASIGRQGMRVVGNK